MKQSRWLLFSFFWDTGWGFETKVGRFQLKHKQGWHLENAIGKYDTENLINHLYRCSLENFIISERTTEADRLFV